MGPSLAKINNIRQALHKKYKLKTVEISKFLGINFKQVDKNTLEFSQGHYSRKLLERHGLAECKSAASPMERLMEPNKSQGSAQLRTEYNSIVGGLQYLAKNTRPDIAFAVDHLARLLLNPSFVQFRAARRILPYIA